MSHLTQTIQEANEGQRTLPDADSLLPGMIADLEKSLPPADKAACDAALGPEASPHQRWCMYFTAERHHRHKQEIERVEIEVFDEQHSQPHEQRR